MSSGNSVLNADSVLALAKRTLERTRCEWTECSMTLNSWDTYRKHLRNHCIKSITRCGMKSCTFREMSTLNDLISHIDVSHLTRYPLPCPMQGCRDTFARHHQLPTHLLNNHKGVMNQDINKPHGKFRQSADIFIPPPHPDSLNRKDLPLLTVTPYPRRQQESQPTNAVASGSRAPLSRRRSQLNALDTVPVNAPDPTDDDIDCHVAFEDLEHPPAEKVKSGGVVIIRPDFFCSAQFSRPAPYRHPPRPPKDPPSLIDIPRSMGWEYFKAEHSKDTEDSGDTNPFT
ncbi:hypothetical protein BD410DRAFT_786948 [Rickenella mellea]|uniref:C2H2-type domain-containing protein n=1 Tax=Rickenella mellea TaxID=50990 RepID=A0A4Y7QA48_9AGAM|nr:hypothetical protein BD410DRAFT_786948 [Rickenella mellea]